jgi:hypothetical protein
MYRCSILTERCLSLKHDPSYTGFLSIQAEVCCGTVLFWILNCSIRRFAFLGYPIAGK